MEGEVREGFLCPICYADFSTALNLDAHFKDKHQDDQNLFKSFKGMYEKAKKKIRGPELMGLSPQDAESSAETVRRTPGYPPSQPGSGDSIPSRCYLTKFKAIRGLRNERYAAQTNVLLIRLGKLLVQLPTDPIRRKAYEQEIVPWLDDKDVSRCPTCAKLFNVIKRKHHCRLCGAVMCKNCTFLLPLDQATKMVSGLEGSNSLVAIPPSPKLRLQPVQAVQSVLSLDSLTDSDFRLCEHCNRLLQYRQTLRQNRSERPIIAQFYERMREALKECETKVVTYMEIYNSLCAGETKHSLLDAQSVRLNILQLVEVVDMTSKRIAVLGMNTESPPQGMALHLQQTIRNAAATYLKQNIVTLPSLPTEEEIAEYQEKRRLQIERRIEEERRREEQESRLIGDLRLSQAAPTQRPPDIPRSTSSKMTIEDGWTPSVRQAIISEDPILQQIGILHGFIDQAQKAGKHDEVKVLKENLMELEQMLDEREEEARSRNQLKI